MRCVNGLNKVTGGRVIVHDGTTDVDVASCNMRPEDVELSESDLSGENAWQGAVEQKVFLGEAIDFRVAVGSRSLLSRQHPTLRTPVGGAIFVHINPEKCRVFAPD